jgi:SAM-dependent methyltransferase
MMGGPDPGPAEDRSIQATYAQQYEALWNRHWWWRARRRFVLARIARLARQRPLTRILDIGCGNGLLFDDLLAHGDVMGIEPDGGLVDPNGRHAGRIRVEPFTPAFRADSGGGGGGPSAGFDLILMLDVLEHLEHDRPAARHVHNLLAPGGFFLLTVPALPALWSRHDDANLHYRRYTKATLRAVLAAAGLDILSLQYYFGWTVLPMGLRRVLAPGKPTPGKAARGGGGAGHGGEAEEYVVRVPPAPVNAAMYAVTRAEQVVLGGVGVPVGSSLIAVCRRGG